MNKLYITSDKLLDEANLLANFTGQIEVCTTMPQDNMYLQLDNNGLCIISSQFQPLYVNDLYNKIYQRRNQLSKELLIQSIKVKPADDILIIDATAGFAKDALLLSLYGYNVLMIEQNPILATVIYYELISNKKQNNLQLVFANSIEFLKNYSNIKPYAIYLDPMFNSSEKSLAKKDMQIIQSLTDGIPSLEEELFTVAYDLAKKVIVKRDNKQPLLVSNPRVTYAKQGKTIRYDVYCRN